jgi:hypothetical protein
MSKSETNTSPINNELANLKELISSPLDTQFKNDHEITASVITELDVEKELISKPQLNTDHKVKTPSSNETIIADNEKTIFDKRIRNKRREYTLIETFESKEEALKRFKDSFDDGFKNYVYRYLIILIFNLINN